MDITTALLNAMIKEVKYIYLTGFVKHENEQHLKSNLKADDNFFVKEYLNKSNTCGWFLNL